MVIATPAVWVPLFGEFWMNNLSVAGSSVYCVVTVVPAKLFVYAVPVTLVAPPLIFPSGWGTDVLPPFASTGTPVSGLIRKFSPVPVTTRMRSTVGLKSIPYPADAGGRSSRGGPLGVGSTG